MLIVCPSCASEYRIESGKVGMEGRSVRCAACRETWFISPADVLAGHEAELAEREGAEPDPVADAAWQEAAATVRAASETSDPSPAAPGTAASAARDGLARHSRPVAVARRRADAARRAAPDLPGAHQRGPDGAPERRPVRPGRVAGECPGYRDPRRRGVQQPAEDGRPAELVIEGDLVGVARTDVPVSTLSVEIRDAAGRALRTFPVAAPRRCSARPRRPGSAAAW